MNRSPKFWSAVTRFALKTLPVALAFSVSSGQIAAAHPHVFVTAKLEIQRNSDGRIIGIKHNWRFDEFFSTSLLLDFDNDGDGALSKEELTEIGQTIIGNIGEFDYFTAWRHNGKVVEILSPHDATAEFGEDYVLEMELHMRLPEPIDAGPGDFKVSVSDPSFYVAFDMADEDITYVGTSSACRHDITLPDFDSLYANGAETLTEAFFDNPDKPDLSDEYYPWIKVSCT